MNIYRNRAEITLTVDDLAPVKAQSPDDDFSVFNSQSYVTLGGKVELGSTPLKTFKSSISNSNSNSYLPIQARPFFKSLYPFEGTITGLVFNKRRILDNIKDGTGYVQGDVVLQASGNVLAGVGFDTTNTQNNKNNNPEIATKNNKIVPEKPFTLPSYNKTITYTITEAIKTTSTPITPRNALFELTTSRTDTNLTNMKLPPDSSESGQDYDYGSCDYPSCAGKITNLFVMLSKIVKISCVHIF